MLLQKKKTFRSFILYSQHVCMQHAACAVSKRVLNCLDPVHIIKNKFIVAMDVYDV